MFEKLEAADHTQTRHDDKKVKSILTAMLRKLQQYFSLVCTPLAKLARVDGPRFSSGILNDAEVLRDFVTLPSLDCSEVELEATSSKRFFFEERMDECSLDGLGDDEVVRLLKATWSADNETHPLLW